MKYLLTLFLGITFIGLLHAQPTQADKEFVRDALKLKKIAYVDSAASFDNDIIKILDADTIKTLEAGAKLFLVTKEEHAYIKKQIDSMKLFAWNEALFKRSKLIREDSLRSIFKNPDSYQASKNFYTQYGNGYYSFSKPIFLRNSTLCIFYSYYSCGGMVACGGYNLTIYKRAKGHWVRWLLLAAVDY